MKSKYIKKKIIYMHRYILNIWKVYMAKKHECVWTSVKFFYHLIKTICIYRSFLCLTNKKSCSFFICLWSQYKAILCNIIANYNYNILYTKNVQIFYQNNTYIYTLPMTHDPFFHICIFFQIRKTWKTSTFLACLSIFGKYVPQT